MQGFDPRTSFGYDVSQRYDVGDGRGDEAETVAFLARLAGRSDALEFAVGTGRIALPLSQRGVPVTGIELSEAMVAQLAAKPGADTGRIALPLKKAGVRVDGIEQSQDMVDRMREKPGGDAVDVTMGDMSLVTTGRRYGLVYLVFNTIGNLLTQDDQVRCFQNAARHLAPGGVFVVECRIPDAPARPYRQFVDVEQVAADAVMLGVAQYDPVTQVLDLNHVRISADGIVLSPISLRLAHPPEFDLMARIAGLRLRGRWGGWNAEPYTATSWRHISVYEPA
jgi:SAM-dependent methyltransferase